jgi:hypothetical protein
LPSIDRICKTAGLPSPNRLRNATSTANMDYQALLAALLVVLILAAAFLTFCYTPPRSPSWQTTRLTQLAKWLRVAGMVRPSQCRIQISLLTGPGLWPFIRRPRAVPCIDRRPGNGRQQYNASNRSRLTHNSATSLGSASISTSTLCKQLHYSR